MWSPETSVLVSLALPIIAALGVLGFGKWPNLREASTLIVAAFLTLNVIGLSAHVFSGGRPEWVLGDWLPGYELAFSVEPLGMMFALVASSLWLVTTVYAIGYMRGHHEGHQTRFFFCFALAIFAAIAAAFAKNLLTLFIAYELMTVSTYPLVTHHGTEASQRGGRVYLGILLSTSIALFMLAIAWVDQIADTLDFQAGGILGEAFASEQISPLGLGVLLGLFAFGIGKAALMPIHRWLPAAMVAPTPVSALLHAVAVVKVGVFSILKVCIYVFGLDLLTETGVSMWVAYVAGYTIVVASLIAWQQDNLKARLAYSTVGQLAYITMGAMLATPESVIGSGMHIVMHAVGKITLFFCAGAIYVAAHKTKVSELHGLGHQMPYTFAAFFVASISIIGLPPGGGAWSKWFLGVGTVQTEQYALLAALMISSLLNVAYLLPIPIRAFGASKSSAAEEEVHGEAPLLCVVPLCVTE